MTSMQNLILDYLVFLYGRGTGEEVWDQLQEKVWRFSQAHPGLGVASGRRSLTQADTVLITYGDQVREPGRKPLQTLREFLSLYTGGWVSNIHILPFYPYSSDDGFSVIDYRQVDERLGTWEDVNHFSRDFGLMFDAVINHISRQSAWFKGYLTGISPYTGYFLEIDPSQDLSQVFRPRTLPLLTQVQVGQDLRHVWTTFSDDQIDLNYANPQVLLEILDILLFYLANHARFIRLDAIAFLWKEIGTRCIHLPQTHTVVKLIHSLFELVAPGAMLITETNVPHAENISYFGDGSDEAQLVYNFALPPLVLHSFRVGDATRLSAWAGGLNLPSKQTTFFNFLASHDGIGVTPVRGILSEIEVNGLVDQARSHGGLVSSRNLPDGSQVPYELNISYFDALSDPKAREPLSIQIDRFITAQAIMVALAGMPGIYFHSLFGSRSWHEGVATTGHNRTINRQKLDRQELENELADPTSRRAIVFQRMRAMLQARSAHPAFSPYSPQKILDLGPAVFCVMRGGESDRRLVCLHNVSSDTQSVSLDVAGFGAKGAVNLLTGQFLAGRRLSLRMPPYGMIWLTLE